MYISRNHVVTKLLHAVVLVWEFLANANGVYCSYFIGFKADNPAIYGTYRSWPINVIDTWQLGGLSNDMIQSVENVIKRSA